MSQASPPFHLAFPVDDLEAAGRDVADEAGGRSTARPRARPGSATCRRRRAWEALHTRLAAEGVRFLITPHVRFRGEVGEQGTFFIEDPAGNALELKTFADPSRIFAR